MIELKAKSQHMNQATLEQCTDLHATPKSWHAFAQGSTLVQPSLHGCMGMGAVVIRDSQMG
jgi:hypothetical protein